MTVADIARHAPLTPEERTDFKLWINYNLDYRYALLAERLLHERVALEHERDEARAKLAALLYQYKACHAEKDEARAKLAALETQYHADSERWIGERDEARAIARRLAAALDDAAVSLQANGFHSGQAFDALGNFRALPWAKDDAQS